MIGTIGQQLQQAYQLIHLGQRQQAMQILYDILRFDPDNADAWWLMANAATNVIDMRVALEQVLRLRPDHQPARQMLNSLNNGFQPPSQFWMTETAQRLKTPPVLYQPPHANGREPHGVIVPPDRSRWKPRSRWHPVATIGAGAIDPLTFVAGIVAAVSLLAVFLCAIVAFSTTSLVINPLLRTPTPARSTPTPHRPNNPFQVDRGTVEINRQHPGIVYDPREYYLHRFHGSAGERLIIDVMSTDDKLNPMVQLYDPEGRRLDYNHDAAVTTRDARLSVTLPLNGVYTVAVSGENSTGRYTLIVWRP